ncbi:MAG: hypothetical protein ACFE9L_10640 [Candidatus Hodarchaeota archaeon]
MTIARDFTNGLKFETASENIRLGTLFCYNLCIIVLAGICVFYILRYEGRKTEARILGSFLIFVFISVLYLGTVPLSPFISFDYFRFTFVIYGFIMIYSAVIIIGLDFHSLWKRITAIFRD